MGIDVTIHLGASHIKITIARFNDQHEMIEGRSLNFDRPELRSAIAVAVAAIEGLEADAMAASDNPAGG